MITAQDILALAKAYSAAAGVPLSTVSSRVFDDGKKLAALENKDADLTLKRAGAALHWFSANWPETAEWPSDIIARPAESEAA